MSVMDLVAKISLDSQDFDKGLKDSESSFSGFGSRIASGAKTMGKVAVGAFAAVGSAVVGSTAAFISSAKEVGAYADNIQKSSQKMQMSAEQYQEWSFIMEHSGSSIESVRGAMIKLGKAAESDSEAFAKLGINQQEFAQMSSGDQWETAIAALQGVADETERAKLAEELFGKSYMEMLPLINTSAEATAEMKQQVHDLGGVMSDDAVNAGAQFQDSLQNMKTALGGLKNNMMGEFLPSLSQVMDGLAAIFSGDESGIGKIQEGITNFASKINEMMPKIIQTVSGIAEALLSSLPQFIDSIAQQLPTILDRAIPLIIDVLVKLSDTIVDALPKIVEAIEKNISTITSGLSKIILSIGQIIVKLFPKVFPMLIKVGVQLITELARGLTENIDVVIQSIIEVVNTVITVLTEPETLSALLECGIKLIIALATGLLQNLPMLLGTVLEVISNVVSFLITDGIPLILQGALDMFKAIGDGLLKAWDYITSKLGEMLGMIIGENGIGGWLSDVVDGAKKIFEGIGDAISGAWETIKNGVVKFGKDIWNGIKEGLGDMLEKGKELIMDLFNGLKKGWDKVKNFFSAGAVSVDIEGALVEQGYSESQAKEAMKIMEQQGEDAAKAYLDGQQKGFDVKSPSRKMRWLGQMVMDGFSLGLEDESDGAVEAMQNTMQDIDYGSMSADISVTDNNGTSRDPVVARLESLERTIKGLGWNVTMPVFVGNKQIDEQYVESKHRLQTRSGGQVDG